MKVISKLAKGISHSYNVEYEDLISIGLITAHEHGNNVKSTYIRNAMITYARKLCNQRLPKSLRQRGVMMIHDTSHLMSKEATDEDDLIEKIIKWNLLPQEFTVVILLYCGYKSIEIAEILQLSRQRISVIVSKIRTKVGMVERQTQQT